MPEFDESKETVEQQALSDQEVWSAIRYLDFDIEDDPSSRNAIFALMAALLIIFITVCELRVRGL
jgi:hypothetical protein